MPPEANVESSFYESLKDVGAILEALSPSCETVGEAIGVVRHALENPGQLRILLSLTTQPPQKNTVRR